MCVPVLCESQSLDQDSVMLDTVYTEQKGMSRQGENINQDCRKEIRIPYLLMDYVLTVAYTAS